MKIFLLLILVLFSKCFLAYGSDFTYRGYFKNEFIFSSINNDSLLNPQNVILNLKETLDISTFLVDSTWSISNTFLLRFKPQLEYRHIKPDTENLSKLVIKEGYFSYRLGYFFLDVGKKVLGWGQGIIWNPSNRIDPKRILPTPLKKGKVQPYLEPTISFLIPTYPLWLFLFLR